MIVLVEVIGGPGSAQSRCSGPGPTCSLRSSEPLSARAMPDDASGRPHVHEVRQDPRCRQLEIR
jgi:hypothetical protein